jgi:trans-aconitate 2-methyltransferase
MNEEVINFYNSYADELIFQKEIGHARYRFIDRVARDMIKAQHSVLDLGCGIGTTSAILSAYCREVVAVDFAPRLLEIAEKRENITYYCCNIADIHFERTFDFICLFDVLEHVETAQVPGVFGAITGHMSDDTNLLIVLPYEKYLDYKRVHHPETIQIIDNSISLDDLNLWARQNYLEVMHYQVLSLFHACDYTYVQMRRDTGYDPRGCSASSQPALGSFQMS